MPVIDNPYEYDKRIPTNVRIDKDIKDIIKKEAEDKGITMADIINDVLVKYYKDK